MKAKDKAEELIEKMSFETARVCALIAIKFARENPLNTEDYNKYLDEIKQEILNRQ